MEQNKQTYLELRQALETAAEAMDPEIRAHSLRTGQRMETLIKEMDKQDLLALWNWGDLSPLNYHDMGKKPNERGIEHTETGELFFKHLHHLFYKISGQAGIFTSIAADICRYHHDHYGQCQLKTAQGRDIPLAGRICAVANVWDHLALDGLKPRQILARLESQSGQYDPEIIAALRRFYERHGTLER
ncbi:hypothetical protein LI142_22860 [Eubacterium limosum]|uniref:HD domain-containing protein n=1 Tax=Eubacterium limosum TaxID=1736 RepID=A0ABT5UVD5_EUBLI|nr:hypothetical protein [Eubacterium limosum]MCB6572337.1 hypothetical protein [Eubacterium limosum]MDE1472917.1 hypothetical protein [Eubacterium limosum]